MKLISPLIGLAGSFVRPLFNRFGSAGAAVSQPAGVAQGSGAGTSSFLAGGVTHLQSILQQGMQGLIKVAKDPRAQETILKNPLVPASVKRQVLALWKKSFVESDYSSEEDAGHVSVMAYLDVLLHLYLHDRNPEIRQTAYALFRDILQQDPLENLGDYVRLWDKVFRESSDEDTKEKAVLVLVAYIQDSRADESMVDFADVLPRLVEFVNQSKDPYFCLQFFNMIENSADMSLYTEGMRYALLGLLDAKAEQFKGHPTAVGMDRIKTLLTESVARLEKKAESDGSSEQT